MNDDHDAWERALSFALGAMLALALIRLGLLLLTGR